MNTLEDLIARDKKHPFQCHIRGMDDYTWTQRALLGLKLIFGARIHYHFCNIFALSFFADQTFNGIQHLKSHSNIVICTGVPELGDAEKLDPETHAEVTQIKVVKIDRLIK